MYDFLFAQDIPQQFKTQSCCFHMPGTQSDPVRLQMEQTQISPSNPRCFGKEQHQNAGEIPSWIFWFAVALNIAPVFWLNQCLTMYFSAIKSMFHPFFPMAESGNVWNPRVLRPQNLPLDQAYPWAPWRSRRRLPRTACHLCRGKGSIERLETLSEVMENSFQITLW